MFENIKQCMYEYEEVYKKFDGWKDLTKEESNILEYLDLHLAEAIMTDFQRCDKGVKVAKIILAMQELSNEIKIKVE